MCQETSNELPQTAKSSHPAQTKRSCDHEKLVAEKQWVAFSRNKDKDGRFKHSTSFAANDIPSVSEKDGLNFAYPCDFYIYAVP